MKILKLDSELHTKIIQKGYSSLQITVAPDQHEKCKKIQEKNSMNWKKRQKPQPTYEKIYEKICNEYTKQKYEWKRIIDNEDYKKKKCAHWRFRCDKECGGS